MGAHRSRRLLTGLVFLFVGTGVITLSSTVHAVEVSRSAGVVKSSTEEPAPNPLAIIGARMGNEQYNFPGMGVYFDATAEHLFSGLASSPNSITNDPSVQDWSLCASLSSPECSSPNGRVLQAYSILGMCKNPDELGCIEDVQIGIGDGPKQSMSLVGYVGEETYFEESQSLIFPRASSPTRWQASDGSHYVVTARTERVFTGSENQWGGAWQQTQFRLQIKRVSSSATLQPTVPSLFPNPDYPGKMRIGVAVPEFSSLKFQDQTAFTVKVRLPDVVSGWFQARMENGVIGSTSLSGNRTVYDFSGTVTPVIVAGGVVRFSDLASDFFDTTYRGSNLGRTNGMTLGPINPGDGTRSLFEYNQWLPYLGETALTTVSQWNVRSSGWPIPNACFSSLKGVSGFLATNAAAYIGLPPTWDSNTGSLDYKVAAPHYDENGQVNVGTYTLSMPVAAAKCLYESALLPPTVDVTVGTEGAAPDFATTLGLTETNGWLNFSVKGFHYSSPTIKVKLGKASLGGGANGLLSVKVNKKLTARSIAKFAGLEVKATSKVKLVVSKASRSRCAIQGTTLVAKATGRCTVTITVTPKRGKVMKKTVSVTVTGPPTITRSITASAKAIAEHAKLEVASSSTIALQVAKSSTKNCRVSGTKIKGLQKGSCKVTVTVTTSVGQVSTKTVNLKVT